MPFLAGRGQASRGYFGSGSTPDAPTLGTLTTSISSPNTVSTPSMTQDANNANFSWSSPGAGGVTIGVPFTAPAFNGGLDITNYEYSTDNGSTWKSAGSTTSPISITTVSSSSSNLSAGTEYTVKLRAVNALGSGTASSGSAKTTPTAVTSYTIRVYNNRGTETLTETITGNTSGTYQRSHYYTAADWSVTVAAINTNGAGSFSSESAAATGWTLASCTNYDASGCDSCGTKSTVCSKWTRAGSSDGPCDVSCGTQSGCSDSWTSAPFVEACVYATGVNGGVSGYYTYNYLGGDHILYTDSGCSNAYSSCSGGFYGTSDLRYCSTSGAYRAYNYVCVSVSI
jgi:hypothetical protein